MSSEQDRELSYDATDPDKMRLPAGTTCGHCVHIYRCTGLFGCKPSNTRCDWSPSRFHRFTAALAKGEGKV